MYIYTNKHRLPERAEISSFPELVLDIINNIYPLVRSKLDMLVICNPSHFPYDSHETKTTRSELVFISLIRGFLYYI